MGAESEENSRIEVEAILATTEIVSKYGGFRFTKSALEGFAGQITLGTLQMRIEHEPQRAFEAYVLDVGVRRIPDTHEYGLWIRYEISQADYTALEGRLGFSIGCNVPLRSGDSVVRQDNVISADLQHFDVQHVYIAAEALSIESTTQPWGHIQLTELESLVKIAIEFGHNEFVQSVASGAMPNVIAWLWRHRRKAKPNDLYLELAIRRSGGDEAVVDKISIIGNEEVLIRDAINHVPTLLGSGEEPQMARALDTRSSERYEADLLVLEPRTLFNLVQRNDGRYRPEQANQIDIDISRLLVKDELQKALQGSFGEHLDSLSFSMNRFVPDEIQGTGRGGAIDAAFEMLRVSLKNEIARSVLAGIISEAIASFIRDISQRIKGINGGGKLNSGVRVTPELVQLLCEDHAARRFPGEEILESVVLDRPISTSTVRKSFNCVVATQHRELTYSVQSDGTLSSLIENTSCEMREPPLEGWRI